MKTIEQRQSSRVHFGLVPEMYDKVSVLYPDSLTEVYVYQLLKEDATYATVGYVEVTYTDTTKRNVSSVTRLAQ
jgi:hypothetical protein